MSLIVYSASAGSGKTYTLALKYIAFALQTEQPTAFSNILAVTFTNKATCEMKDRILSQLYNLAHGGILDAGFMQAVCKETGLGQDEIQKRAHAALYAIIHDYDHFHVETIDSFFQSMLTNLAHELGLTRGFRVELDDMDVINRAVDRLLLTLEDKSLVYRNPTAAKSILRMMQQYVADNKGWNIAKDLKKFAEKNLFSTIFIKHQDELEKLTNDAAVMSKLWTLLTKEQRETERQINRLATELKEYAKGITDKGVKTKEVITYTNYILEREYYSSSISQTVIKAKDDSTALIFKTKATDISYSIAAELSRKLSDTMERIDHILPMRNSCMLTRMNLNVLSLLSSIGSEVTNINSERGAFLLAQTPELFDQLVQGDDASFIFEKAGTTFHHVMIDEFQDTSHLQWNNFRKLLIESLSIGNDCLLVGDIKQSIYRWRGGDWDILYNIPQKEKEVRLEALDRNYRSDKFIVKFNNTFFVKAASYLDDFSWHIPDNWWAYDDPLITQDMLTQGNNTNNSGIRFLHLYKEVEQKLKPNAGEGYIRIDLSKEKREIDEILDELCKQTMRLHNDYHTPFGNMGILVRTNKEAAQIIEYFSLHHPEVPINSDEAFKFSASPLILSLIYALKYIDDENDSVSFEMLKQCYDRLFPLNDDTNKDIVSPRWKHLLKFLCNGDNKKGSIANYTRANLRKMPLYELIYKLLMEMGFYGKDGMLLKGQEIYLYNFEDAVLNYLEENPSDIHTFLTYWDEKLNKQSIVASSIDAVSVLTIHKSKGLQKHTVFIPFADFYLDKDVQSNYIWCESPREVQKDDELNRLFGQLPLVPIATQSPQCAINSIYKNDYLYEHQQMRIDSLNTLYVAFTRAEKNLLIWSNPPHQSGGVSAYDLIDAFVYDREAGFSNSRGKKSNKKKAAQTIEEQIVKEYGRPSMCVAKEEKKNVQAKNPFEPRGTKSDSIAFYGGGLQSIEFKQSNQARLFMTELNDSECAKKEIARSEFINRGKLLHQIFSMITTEKDVRPAVQKAFFAGLINTPQEADEMIRLIDKSLAQPCVKLWFDGSYSVITERNILLPYSLRQTSHFAERPDRIMRNQADTVIVDYKFGVEKEEYTSQVQDYMQLLRSMGYPNVKGFLWFVLENRIKEVV